MKFHDRKFQKSILLVALGVIAGFNSSSISAKSVYISNFGFESGLRDWTVVKPVTTSALNRVGSFSAKITGENGLLSRKLSVDVNTDYQLSAYIRGKGTIAVEVAGKTVLASSDSSGWRKTLVSFNSGTQTSITIFAMHNEGNSYFDQFALKTVSPSSVSLPSKAEATQVTALDPELPPSGNFELVDWKLSVPTDVDNNGKSDTVAEEKLASGYTNADFFYTKPNGGMAFKVPVQGFKTSKNTKFTRVELREMLRRGNTDHSTKGVGPNNWVFSSASQEDQNNAGAVDGQLTGTVSIDHVTTSGEPKQVGRVVFAQIHANKDEPIRFYYRKLPNHSKGSIYFAHEPLEEKDVYFEMVGSRSSKAKEPEDGVELGEKFSYEINVKGDEMTVKLFRDAKDTITQVVDMSKSGYDTPGQYMYFKAGAYLQDSTGNADDYAEVVYYALDNKH